jgi:alkaline phosphatase
MTLLGAIFIFSGAAEAGAKYVFLFIGDGMGTAQRNAAELYLAGMRMENGDDSVRDSQLVMNSLPVSGEIRTNSLSGITDSAAAGTALATGRKTSNGAIAMNPASGEKFQSVAHAARRKGMKAGIVTSSFLQDATPAVFFGHSPKRTDLYALGVQLSDSGFDYFAGGGLLDGRVGKNGPRPLDAAISKGYRVVNTPEGFRSLEAKGSGRVIATHPRVSGGYMPWVIDGDDAGVTLADFVDKGIALLDGKEGFFMMVEGGKIDLACHANDAAAAVHEVIAFDRAVERAVKFLDARPDETLIVVTSDHETGGMTYSASCDVRQFYKVLSTQKGSYAAFERTISPRRDAKFDAALGAARAFFGPYIGDSKGVRSAYALSMTPKNKRKTGRPEYKKLYGPYDPFTVACIRESNAHLGITWTTFYHTGKNIPVSAIGAGASMFSGEYENTEIYHKLMAAMN